VADITIRISSEDLADAVCKVLTRTGTFAANPLPNLIAKAIDEQAVSILTRVQNITQEFVSSNEFAQRIRAVYRDALLGEAARMGRNAARAAVNAPEVNNG
jgi:hypothetical protein